jgi:dolichol kinase
MEPEATPVTTQPASEAGMGLDALVARTAGPQWWRKAFHAFNATLAATLLAVLDLTRAEAVGILLALLTVALIIDVVRLRSTRANELFFRAFGKLASPREARAVASSTWYVTGILVVVALFPLDVAVTSVLVMGLGDPAAALMGRTLGRRPFLGGTLEGSFAFFAVCVLLIGFRHGWPAAVVAGAAAALAERRAWPLDDNLAVPVVCAAAIQAVAWLA